MTHQATPLSWVLQESALRRLAGERAFLRAEEYLRDGRVRALCRHGERLSAAVRGARGEYRVELWAEDEGLQTRCACPAAAAPRPCKHAVAVALSWLRQPPAEELTLDDAEAYLRALDRRQLEELLLGRALVDEALRQHLLLRAAIWGPAAPHRQTIRAAIDRAVAAEDPVSFPALPAYERRIGEVIDALAELVAQARRRPDAAEAAVELCEHGLWALRRALVAAGRYRARLRLLVRRMQLLHSRACEAARPEPRALAARLLPLELEGVLRGVAGLYAPALGEAGLREYERLARAEWEALPPLGPGEADAAPGRRARLQYLMEGLCWQRGDLPGLLEIKRRDLSSPRAFSAIAEIYRELGQPDEARRWAERGKAAFPQA